MTKGRQSEESGKRTIARSVCRGLAALALGLLAAGLSPGAQAGEHRLGLGIHYFETLDGFPDIGELEDIEDSGSAWVVSYQYKPRGIFTFEIDVEIFDDGYGGSTDSAVAPQVFVLVGGSLYGGVGVGVTVASSLEDDVSDPFFMARLGYCFDLLGPLQLDLSATYRFDEWDAVGDLDLDTDNYTLGAVARFSF